GQTMQAAASAADGFKDGRKQLMQTGTNGAAQSQNFGGQRMRLVTYREFSRLGKKRGWTVEMLAELFKGKIGHDDRAGYFHESLKNYFERILTCRWLNPETRRTEDRSNVVIAYRSVIEFYERELHASEEAKSETSQARVLDKNEERE